MIKPIPGNNVKTLVRADKNSENAEMRSTRTRG